MYRLLGIGSKKKPKEIRNRIIPPVDSPHQQKQSLRVEVNKQV